MANDRPDLVYLARRRCISMSRAGNARRAATSARNGENMYMRGGAAAHASYVAVCLKWWRRYISRP